MCKVRQPKIMNSHTLEREKLFFTIQLENWKLKSSSALLSSCIYLLLIGCTVFITDIQQEAMITLHTELEKKQFLEHVKYPVIKK